MSADIVIFCKSDDGRRHYYAGFNGQRGRAVVGAKADAVRLTPPLADTVLRQLAALDARDWKLARDEPGGAAVELEP